METFNNEYIDDDIYSVSACDSISSVTSIYTTEDEADNQSNCIYNIAEFKKHVVVNTRNEDSNSETIKLKLNDINFDCNMNEIIDTYFYEINQLNNTPFSDMYNIICMSQMIIFVDNYKLTNMKSKRVFPYLKKRKNMLKVEFPGCTFFPFEYISKLKKDIHILNNNILNAELKNQKIYNNDEICYGLCFDEGDIFKDCLYKKMEIVDKILFVPIDKYQLRQTEYRIRGFCQIVEELGAKEIEIKFQRNDNKIKKTNIETTIGSDIEMIAGSLGLSSSKTSSEEEAYNYTLKYPDNNTILINEKAIRKKIKKKKFIISEAIYNSNLELQYVIRSRCRHFITKYSTVFTFDNSTTIDKALATKFKLYNIDIGFNLDTHKTKKYYLQIITNVIFSDQTDYCNNLNGYSVSLDKIGFNFLIDSLKHGDDFSENGIYKIMVFINLYIEKVLKHEKKAEYKKVVNIMKKIKKNLTIKEYSQLLCNYFNKSSHWIHFTNFIDLLAGKTQSYDKLGYLIIVNQLDISLTEKINILIRFIQEKCIEKKIENKFWTMLKPHNPKLQYFLRNKLLCQYNFINCFNWYSLNSLINNISLYTIDFSNLSDEAYLMALKQNMDLGYRYWEFYNNIVPYIIRTSQSIHYKSKEDYYLSSLLEASLNYESFTVSKVNSLNDLNQYINKKVDRIKLAYKMLDEYKVTVQNYNSNTEKDLRICYGLLNDFILSEKFSTEYGYFNKKLNMLLGENNELARHQTLVKFLEVKNEDGNICNNLTINGIAYEAIKKLITYNEKLCIKGIPPNYLGFELVLTRYRCGIKELEYERIVKPFIKKLIKTLAETQFSINSIEYQEMLDIDIFSKITHDFFSNNCQLYYNLIINLVKIINEYVEFKFDDTISNGLIL